MKTKYYIRVFLCIISCSFYIYHIMYGEQGIHATQALKKENAAIEQKIERLAHQTEDLNIQLEKLQTSAFEREKYIKEKLLLSSDEDIYLI